MKMKGISVFEQHVEKVVLGAAGVLLLAVVAQQILTSPNQVRVGNETLPPERAFVPVERAARDLAAEMEATTITGLPESRPFGLGERGALGRAAAFPEAPGLSLGPAITLGGVAPADQAATGVHAPPAVPAVSRVVARAFTNTISPVEVVRNPALAELLPREQPFDAAVVSIEGFFDGTALRAALEADPDGAGPASPLPISWWRDVIGGNVDQVEIIGVEVQRETLLLPDGSTPPADQRLATVGSLPGRPNAIQLWTANVRNLGDVPAAMTMLRGNRESVQRPPFLATVAGPAWERPSEAPDPNEVGDQAAQVLRLQNQLNQIDTRLADLRERLTAAGRPPAARTPEERERLRQERREEQRQPRPGRGGGEGGAARPGEGGARGDRENDPERQQRLAATLDRQVRSEEAARVRVVERLAALGVAVATDEPRPTGDQPLDPALGVEGPSTLQTADLPLWFHDLRVQPGARYRYRMRVVINNPLFGRNLPENQRALGTSPTLAGAWSEWSAPVDVDRFEYFFVTSAEPASTVTGRPRATVEMFQFYYGYYRVATVSVEPGDTLLGRARLPELRLADMSRLRQLAQDPAWVPAERMAPPPLPGGRPGPGGRPMTRPDEQGDPRIGLERGVGARPPGVGDALVNAGFPEWMNIEVGRERPLSVPAMLLDVTTLASALNPTVQGSRERTAVVLRDQSGRMLIRSPQTDRSDPVYRRVEASERAGRTQGAPVLAAPAAGPPGERPAREPAGGGGG